MQVGSPIKDVIEQAKKETTSGLGSDWELKAPIELELSAVVEANGKGGFNIGIVNVGAKVRTEEVQKIKVSVGPKNEAEEAEKKARIAKAELNEVDYLVKRGNLKDMHPNALKIGLDKSIL